MMKFKIFDEIEEFYTRQSLKGFYENKSEIDDFFMIITFGEIFGIENPYNIQMLDMLPILIPKFHDWHQKVGVKSSFFENFPCSCCC